MLAPPLQRLVTELGKLPGIGNRTAQRLAFHVLRASAEDANALAAGPAAPQLSEEELVSRFVEEFDAEVLPPEEEST